MTTSKWICWLVVALLAIGPFAPLTAMAQMAPPPSGPPPQPPPGVAPMPPPPPPAPRLLSRQPGQGAAVGAGFLNIVYVPGKAIMCGVGTLASAGLMLLTLGNAYHAAVNIFDEGCGGQWALTAYDVANIRPPEEPY